MKQKPVAAAVILAGGSGSRMNSDLPKQYMNLCGRPVISYTIEAFQKAEIISSIVVVAHPDFHDTIEEIRKSEAFGKLKHVTEGGDTRQSSSYKGIQALSADPPDMVFIHDAARPFIGQPIIQSLYDVAAQDGAAVCAVPSTDTIYITNIDGCVNEIPERSMLYNAQTPQVFNYDLILQAHRDAIENEVFSCTDDVSLVLRLGKNARIVTGGYENIKLTTPADLEYARRYISSQ